MMNGGMIDHKVLPMLQEGGGFFDWVKSFFQDEPKKKTVTLTMPQMMKIQDRRVNSLTTGKPINPNSELLTGEYPSDRIYNIVKAAKRYNIDPYEALAIDLRVS